MTVQTYFVKQNDLLPWPRRTLELNDQAVNIEGWQGVTFHMRVDGAAAPKVDRAANVIDAAHGVVEYQWQEGDTDTAGEFWAEWEAINPAGLPLTFPNAPGDAAETEKPHDRVLISEELA